jgi:hypothetical protein
LGTTSRQQSGGFSWAFVLRPPPGGKTRLFIGARSNHTRRSAAWFIEFVIGPGDFVNAGAMLRGIKYRVERHRGVASPPIAISAERAEVASR